MSTLVWDRTAVGARPVVTVVRRVGARWKSAVWLAPLLVLAFFWQFVGMANAPQRIDDEGTYVAQAYAVEYFHTLGHYTYWYDHPPLGWIQLAGYTTVTDAFNRASNAVLAGREAMLFFQLVSCLLLWVLARRLGMQRWAAAVAVALFSLSPLAVQFHRTVYLDNIATPWLLGAFILAASPQRRLSAYTGAALCFVVAVLTKETSLLLLPALALQLWHMGSGTQTRRYGLAVAGTVFMLGCGFYFLYALIKGELLPGPGHVSLYAGLKFQLFSRGASGYVLSAGTLSNAHLQQWLNLDHVQPLLAVVCLPFALVVRKLRPVALALVLLLATLFRPGYLPVPFVIAMLPFAALVIAGVAGAAVHRRPLMPLVATGAAVSLVFAVPAWASKQKGLFIGPLDVPVTQAEHWVEQNVPRDQRLMVDDAFWVDLVRNGFPRDNVVWYYKIDTDSAVERLSPHGWRDYDYILSTQSLRSSTGSFPQVSAALAHSSPVAVFGTGQQRVEVLQITPQTTAATQAAQRADGPVRSTTEVALAGNPGLSFSGQAKGKLLDGGLDDRAANLLLLLSLQQRISVTSVPQDAGEVVAQLPAREVVLRVADDAAVRATINVQAAVLRPSVTTLANGELMLTWLPSAIPLSLPAA